MSEPKFKAGDFARVKRTAPWISRPGERVQVYAIGEVTADEKMHTLNKVPVGRLYICDCWVEGDDSPWLCYVGEEDLEPDS